MGGVIESTLPKGTSDSAKSKDTLKDGRVKITPFPRQRSRGQLARRNSITKGNEGLRDRKRSEKRRQAALKGARHATSPLPFRDGSNEEKPLIGALFFTDIIFIAFTYLFNLLRTCGLAELADVAAKGLYYAITQLPSDMYRRWTLSTPPAVVLSNRKDKRSQQRRKRKSVKVQLGGSSSESEASEMQHQPVAFTSSQEPEPTQTLSGSPDQLSPFHHLVILLVRFACSNFPHLVPRVLFAEETIGPFVYWRTGGGSNAMVQEFSNLQERQLPVLPMGQKPHRGLVSERSQDQQRIIEPAFRAYLISKDARLPLEVQRTNLASRSATTLLYLHGGGFSLGSVAFYAEALLRLRAKICALEAAEGNEDVVAEARCVAVEYDLSPAARFPTPLLQCLRCYAHLIEVERLEPSSICIAGDSAGGNLAMGLLLCLDGQMKGEKMLSERDWSKLPMPGKALLISPWVDLRPHHAHSFCDLRGEKDVKSKKRDVRDDRGGSLEEDKKLQGWTDAVAAFDWDYVASEALLHFAQVYTGVLPAPRRVRGPVGWFAHVCSVMAKEYNEPGKTKAASHGSAFSSIIGPSKKVAQATHDLLSDPFLFSILGLKDVDFLSDMEESQAISNSVNDPTSSFAPLFTSSDRKTDSVPSKKQLYEPIRRVNQDETSFSNTAQREAEELLDTHPLISPTVGDWRRIKLKGGCLVTWGERERMAEDIESWVQAVHRDIESEKNAPPAQDGESYQPRPNRISFNDDDMDGEEEEDCWIETAVEKGPGGVHAWPFVSMYLAGSEAERQRGLDLLADFVARSPMETSASSVAEYTSVAASMMDRDAPTSMTDPPHAAPDSPLSETGSVGSMPSDVDLHGLVDDDDDNNNRFFQGPGPSIDIGEAARIAHEIRSRDTSVDDTSHGLGLSNDVDSIKASSLPLAKAVVKTTPKRMTKSVIKTDPPHQQHQAKHSPIKAKFVGSTSSRQSANAAAAAARHIVEKERGRSRSPRGAGHLNTSNSMTSSSNSSTSSGGSATSSSENLPHFISSVRLHRPAAMQAQLIHEAVELPRGRQNPTQSVTPLWWTSSAKEAQPSVERGTTTTAKSDDLEDEAFRSEGVKGKQREQDDSLDETAPILSPIESLSPPSQDEETVEELQAKEESTLAPIDISFYKLSPYAIRRAEPEGLSDIAEEGSVMSGSITSAGDGGGFASRSLSPEDRHLRGGHDRDGLQQTTSLTAASLLLRDQIIPGEEKKPRWPIEDDDDDGLKPIEGSMTKEKQQLISEYKMREVLAQTEADSESSIPKDKPRESDIPTASVTRSSSTIQSDTSSSDGTPRKKPKGDVWW